MASRKRLGRFLLNPWTLLLAVGLVVGGIVYFTMRGGESEGEAGPPQQPAIPVQVESVRPMSLAETVQAVGTLRAVATVELRPEAAGRVVGIHFEEGGMVEQGQVLFELDDRKLSRQLSARQAAVRAAAVRVANARRTFQRQEQLRERGVVSVDEFDQAQEELDSALADLERAEAEVELVEAQLEDMRIVAPFSGQISAREVDLGAYVAAGDGLATLYQTDPLEIGFSVPERYLGRVRRGQTVEVTVAAYPGQPFEGEVHFISPAVEEATRTFRVRARIPNPEMRLSPGAFATAVVTVNVREGRPVVSAESLVATRRGYSVFVVEGDQAYAREVQTGLRQDGVVEILDGVEVGEQVVRTGHLRLSDGGRVAVVHPSQGDGSQGLAGMEGEVLSTRSELP